MYCCNCGLVHYIQFTKRGTNQGWLPCTPYEGPAMQEPTGYMSADGDRVHWFDRDNKSLTREQFALEHGVDPWTVYCSRPENRNKTICKGFENRCKKH